MGDDNGLETFPELDGPDGENENETLELEPLEMLEPHHLLVEGMPLLQADNWLLPTDSNGNPVFMQSRGSLWLEVQPATENNNAGGFNHHHQQQIAKNSDSAENKQQQQQQQQKQEVDASRRLSHTKSLPMLRLGTRVGVGGAAADSGHVDAATQKAMRVGSIVLSPAAETQSPRVQADSRVSGGGGGGGGGAAAAAAAVKVCSKEKDEEEEQRKPFEGFGIRKVVRQVTQPKLPRHLSRRRLAGGGAPRKKPEWHKKNQIMKYHEKKVDPVVLDLLQCVYRDMPDDVIDYIREFAARKCAGKSGMSNENNSGAGSDGISCESDPGFSANSKQQGETQRHQAGNSPAKQQSSHNQLPQRQESRLAVAVAQHERKIAATILNSNTDSAASDSVDVSHEKRAEQSTNGPGTVPSIAAATGVDDSKSAQKPKFSRRKSAAGKHHHLHQAPASLPVFADLIKSVNPEALYTNVKISNIANITLDELFEEFKEPDQDGRLSLPRAQKALEKLKLLGSSGRRLAGIMQHTDVDNDGFINKHEFQQLIYTCRDIKTLQFQRSRISLQEAVDEKWEVFLGGSCNPTTWRKDLAMPLLDDAGITYFNPQVDEWSPDLLIQENKAKQSAKILFFVIDGRTRAMASMLEVAELICGGKCVVLTIVDVPEDAVIAGEAVNVGQRKDLNRTRAYLADIATRHQVPVFKSVLQACHYTIQVYQRMTFTDVPAIAFDSDDEDSDEEVEV